MIKCNTPIDHDDLEEFGSQFYRDEQLYQPTHQKMPFRYTGRKVFLDWDSRSDNKKAHTAYTGVKGLIRKNIGKPVNDVYSKVIRKWEKEAHINYCWWTPRSMFQDQFQNFNNRRRYYNEEFIIDENGLIQQNPDYKARKKNRDLMIPNPKEMWIQYYEVRKENVNKVWNVFASHMDYRTCQLLRKDELSTEEYNQFMSRVCGVASQIQQECKDIKRISRPVYYQITGYPYGSALAYISELLFYRHTANTHTIYKFGTKQYYQIRHQMEQGKRRTKPDHTSYDMTLQLDNYKKSHAVYPKLQDVMKYGFEEAVDRIENPKQHDKGRWDEWTHLIREFGEGIIKDIDMYMSLY